MRKFVAILALLLAVLIPVAFNACGVVNFIPGKSEPTTVEVGGDGTGNPMVPVGTKAFTPISRNFKLELCVYMFRFSEGGSSRFDFNFTPAFILELDPSGTYLGDIPVPARPAGYDAFSLAIVNSQCPGINGAARITNDFGTFTVDLSTVTGEVFFRTLAGAPAVRPEISRPWTLDMTPFLNGLANVQTSADFQNLILTTSGGLSQ